MNILIALNDNYVRPTMTMLKSLFDSNSWGKIAVYLLYIDINDSNLKKMRTLTEESGHAFHPIYITDDRLKDVPTRFHFSVETNFRLFAFEYLPKEVEKILYLDPDMIIKRSLKNFYTSDMKDYYYYAAPELIVDSHVQYICKRYHLPKESKYVNAGVLLINLAAIRENEVAEEIYERLMSNVSHLKYTDQDYINIFCRDKIRVISSRYNVNCRFQNTEDKLLYPFEWLDEKINKKNRIVHYAGSNKPWNKGYKGKYGWDYYKYAFWLEDREFVANSIYNMMSGLYYRFKDK